MVNSLSLTHSLSINITPSLFLKNSRVMFLNKYDVEKLMGKIVKLLFCLFDGFHTWCLINKVFRGEYRGYFL